MLEHAAEAAVKSCRFIFQFSGIQESARVSMSGSLGNNMLRPNGVQAIAFLIVSQLLISSIKRTNFETIFNSLESDGPDSNLIR